MPPKPASAARPPLPPRRVYTNAADKLIPSSNHSTPITLTSSGSAAAVIPTPTTVIPANLEPSQKILPKDQAFTGKPPQTPSHAATFSPQSPQKARVANPGLAKPDEGKIRSGEPEKKMLVNLGPEKSIHEGAVVMSGNGKDESLIQAVTADQAAPATEKKKKMVKKLVKVVKKVIVKKRVPKSKGVLMSGSENQKLVEKSGTGTVQLKEEIIKSSNLENDANVGSQTVDGVMENPNPVSDFVVEKSNLVNGVVEKPELDKAAGVLELGTVQLKEEIIKSSNLDNDANVGSQTVDEVMENPNPVSDVVVENSNLVDRVVEKTELDKAARVLEPPVACEKGIELMEANSLKLDSNTRGLETVESDSNVGSRVVPQSDNTREKNGNYTVENRKTGNGEILENGSGNQSQGLLVGGEMEAKERRKRRDFEIFVGGLNKGTSEFDIRKVFEKAGKVIEVRLATSSKTGKDKCFAFVRFATASDANNALENYSKVEIHGKKCDVTVAKTYKWSNKQANNFTSYASEQLSKAYPQDTMKLDEPRRNLVGSVQGQANFDSISFTTDRFVHSYGQRAASSNYIPPPQNMVTMKLNEPRRNLVGSDQGQANFDAISFNTDRFPHSFGQRAASSNYIPPPQNMDTMKLNEPRRNLVGSGQSQAKFDAISFTTDRFPHSIGQRAASSNHIFPPQNMDTMKLNEPRRNIIGSGQSQVNVDAISFTTDRFVHGFGQRVASTNYVPPPQSMDTMKLNETRRNLVGSGQSQANFDAISFTTDKFAHSLGQRAAPSNYIPPPQNMGPSILDHRVPLPGTKRPFSLVAHDPSYAEPKMLPPWHFRDSHLMPGPSVPSNGFSTAPFPYHHQHRPSFTPGPVNGVNMHPGHFQRNEQDPHYEKYLSYPRN